MTKRWNTETFVSKAILKYETKYDYSSVVYRKVNIPVQITCNQHKIVFQQRPDVHLRGMIGGCPECVKISKQQTNFKNSGVLHNWCNGPLRKIQQNTMQKLYGVDHNWKSPKIKANRIQTWMTNLGVDNPFKSKEIKRKIQNTIYNSHGVYNISHKHMINVLPLLLDFNWLYNEYVNHQKTATQIALEHNINDTTVGTYLKHHNIPIRKPDWHSQIAINWLESIIQAENIFIQHARNIGEYKLPGTRYSVDGYCQETNTCYEFHGDWFHGNPIIYPEAHLCGYYGNIPAKVLYDKTLKKEQIIRELGYNLIVMWEYDWINMIRGTQ